MSLTYWGNDKTKDKSGWEYTPDNESNPVDFPLTRDIYFIYGTAPRTGTSYIAGYKDYDPKNPPTTPIYRQDGRGVERYQVIPPVTVSVDPKTGQSNISIPPGVDTRTAFPYGTSVKAIQNEAAIPLTYNAKRNTENQKTNELNSAKNNFYQYVQNIVTATNQGSYQFLDAKKTIESKKADLVKAGISDEEATKIVDNITGSTGQFTNYYRSERVQPWDPSVLPGNLSSTVKTRNDLGSNFNTYSNGLKGYYAEKTPQGRAAAAWDEALSSNNLDILERYKTREAYLNYDYLQQITDPTKSAADISSIRGSEKTSLSPLVTDYREQVFPDAIAQQTRDEVQNKIFGLQQTTGQPGYQFKEGADYTTKVSDALNASVQDSEIERTKRFGQLRQSVLQDTINALIAAKRQETNIAFFRSSSVGQEIEALQQDVGNAMLGDLSVGGIVSPGSAQALKSKFDTGLGDIFGTKNGLIYNWEDWFNREIERKYSGSIDIPNDYVPANLRTLSNGFVDEKTSASWKKYDDAYAALKINPANFAAQTTVASVPSDYVPVENRKTVKQDWTNYETQLKAAGYVDTQTAASWSQYDDAYKKLQANPNDQAAKDIYNKRPADYVPPEKRMDKDVQFVKDFFSSYLKPRFDASQSIAEFQDYIDVTKDTQNPFQTQDRIDALKLAAQTSISNWFTSLQQAGDSRFNSDYYFDPINYLKTNGIGDPSNPLLPGAAFTDYANTAAGQNALRQSQKVNSDWEAAKQNTATTDDYGNTINWAQEAYRYGIDVNNKQAFAQLHYQLVGQNTPQKDEKGNIVRNPDGTVAIQRFDAAPDVYAPQIANTYIAQVLTPYLIDKSNKMGSVFGQFVKPSDYVDEILKATNLPQNQDQWKNILQNYGIDPNSSLSEIKNTLIDSLSQDATTDIKKKIGTFITKNTGKLPTQSDIGVEYIQRSTTPSGTTEAPSGVYALFKNAGFTGSEQEFYSTFMPDASPQDISILNATYTTSGKAPSLLPTITGTGMEQIATMAQLFGDTSISEVLGTAGVTMPTGVKPSLFQELITPSGEEFGIGDPFAEPSGSFSTISGTTSSGQTSQMGIGNPFDDIGISDPFSDPSDPFTSSSIPFSSTKSSISNPKIIPNENLFGPSPTFKSSSSFSSSLFSSFGGF
jgi:hypothetical protein